MDRVARCRPARRRRDHRGTLGPGLRGRPAREEEAAGEEPAHAGRAGPGEPVELGGEEEPLELRRRRSVALAGFPGAAAFLAGVRVLRHLRGANVSRGRGLARPGREGGGLSRRGRRRRVRSSIQPPVHLPKLTQPVPAGGFEGRAQGVPVGVGEHPVEAVGDRQGERGQRARRGRRRVVDPPGDDLASGGHAAAAPQQRSPPPGVRPAPALLAEAGLLGGEPVGEEHDPIPLTAALGREGLEGALERVGDRLRPGLGDHVDRDAVPAQAKPHGHPLHRDLGLGADAERREHARQHAFERLAQASPGSVVEPAAERLRLDGLLGREVAAAERADAQIEGHGEAGWRSVATSSKPLAPATERTFFSAPATAASSPALFALAPATFFRRLCS